MSSIEDIRAERLRKVELLREKGIDPYPATSLRDRSCEQFLSDFESLTRAAGKATLAGRIMALRRHGGSTFLDLFDGTAKVQCFLREEDLGKESYELFVDAVDASDFIEISGTAYTTKRGEKTLLAASWRMLAKSLRQVPDAWYGLHDEEERYRRRYLDILLNPEAAGITRKRSLFWNTIREFLLKRDFIEVETPILENTTGGADARPFVTHHNALDIDLYLRVSAGELWQKKLLVAGLTRTFEIGRIFRNEGMSAEHLQDYTQLEYYMAYADFEEGMRMTTDLYREIADKVFGTRRFKIRGFDVNLDSEWVRYDFVDLIKKNTGVDPLTTNLKDLHSRLNDAEIDYDPKLTNIERGVDLLWKQIRRTLSGPGFLVRVPVYLEPLAKRSRDDERLVERFQVILAGSEMGKGYSELNDAVDQRERFQHQQALRDAGDEEAQMADMEFVEALEYGMPPALGFGLSERLFSFLMDKSVREGQLFPLMRPRR